MLPMPAVMQAARAERRSSTGVAVVAFGDEIVLAGMLLAGAEEAVDGGTAVGAVDPFAVGAELELRRFRVVADNTDRGQKCRHIDAVDGAALDEFVHKVIGVVAVPEDILAAEKHLLRRIRHGCLEKSNALPRIFAEVTNTGIEGRAAP